MEMTRVPKSDHEQVDSIKNLIEKASENGVAP